MDLASSSLGEVVVVVAGGLLADAHYLLEKLEDDGSLSVWAGLETDPDPVKAACAAGPLPNNKIRVTTVGELRSAGFDIEFTDAAGAAAPDRHLDATPSRIDLPAVEDFISCFGEPIVNPGRSQ